MTTWIKEHFDTVENTRVTVQTIVATVATIVFIVLILVLSHQ